MMQGDMKCFMRILMIEGERVDQEFGKFNNRDRENCITKSIT